MRLWRVVALTSLLMVAAERGQGQIVLDNGPYLQDCYECESGISKEEFFDVIGQINDAYEERFKAHKGRAKIWGDWNNSEVVAQDRGSYGSWEVFVSGGLARRPEITKDGFTLVMCHEIGHHLADLPYVEGQDGGVNIIKSKEGQADYFATQSCAKNLWKDDLERNAEARSFVDWQQRDQASE